MKNSAGIVPVTVQVGPGTSPLQVDSGTVPPILLGVVFGHVHQPKVTVTTERFQNIHAHRIVRPLERARETRDTLRHLRQTTGHSGSFYGLSRGTVRGASWHIMSPETRSQKAQKLTRR
jgi:hypothetical protein